MDKVTIVKRVEGVLCGHCGQDGAIDHVATGKRAEDWRRESNLVQTAVANGMGISQAYYSALVLGRKDWTNDLVQRFEAFMLPVLQKKGVNVAEL